MALNKSFVTIIGPKMLLTIKSVKILYPQLDKYRDAGNTSQNIFSSTLLPPFEYRWELQLPNEMKFADIDECLIDNGGCSHHCYNIPGTFYCGCPEGTTMARNNLTCYGK